MHSTTATQMDADVAQTGRKVLPKLSYGAVKPRATYSPWHDHAQFMASYVPIKRSYSTLVDIYRCFELWQLVEQTAGLGGDILEVGVWRGGTGCLMASCAQKMGSGLRVFLCDTFAGVVKAGPMDSRYRNGEHANTTIGHVHALAGQLGVENIAILPGIFPDDTGHLVADRRFSLCHIDVDVYAGARDILAWVWPRLHVGGAVVYDDCGFSTCDGVTRFVNEQMPRRGAVTIHNLNGHAVTIKVE